MLIGLYKLLMATDKPFLCSGIYAGIACLFTLLLKGFLVALIVGAVSFVLSSIYFWLLSRFQTGLAHWFILIGGLVIGFV